MLALTSQGWLCVQAWCGQWGEGAEPGRSAAGLWGPWDCEWGLGGGVWLGSAGQAKIEE